MSIPIHHSSSTSHVELLIIHPYLELNLPYTYVPRGTVLIYPYHHTSSTSRVELPITHSLSGTQLTLYLCSTWNSSHLSLIITLVLHPVWNYSLPIWNSTCLILMFHVEHCCLIDWDVPQFEETIQFLLGEILNFNFSPFGISL